MAIERSLRFRVNVSVSVKGVKTWECTTDGEGFEMDEIMKHSDALVAELEKRYPSPEETSKDKGGTQ